MDFLGESDSYTTLKKNLILCLVLLGSMASTAAFAGLDANEHSDFGTIECFPEWYPASGVIVSWLDFDDYYLELVTKLARHNVVTIIVDSKKQLQHVRAILTQNNVDLGRIVFYAYIIDDVWIVDYSPFFVRQNRMPLLLDLRYHRHLDDRLPEFLGAVWGLSVRDVPLFLEGGNVMTDGKGVFFTTTEILEQNPHLSEQQIRDVFRETMGCRQLHILKKLNDGTGHIDMFAKLLCDDLMLLGQYRPDDPEYAVLEFNADYIKSIVCPDGRTFDVIRVPMPGEPDNYFSYTNALILNSEVFVPVYNDSDDDTALDVFRQAMPEYKVIPVFSEEPILSGGAVHCTTKHIPDWNVSTDSLSLTK